MSHELTEMKKQRLSTYIMHILLVLELMTHSEATLTPAMAK